jgi:hypothetical protein
LIRLDTGRSRQQIAALAPLDERQLLSQCLLDCVDATLVAAVTPCLVHTVAGILYKQRRTVPT